LPTQVIAHHPATRLKLTRINRIVALVLALIWLIAGTTAVVLGFMQRRLLLPALGTVAIWYGLLWLRVFREGKQLQWRDALRPWRQRHE
jgi:hypothetical protein